LKTLLEVVCLSNVRLSPPPFETIYLVFCESDSREIPIGPITSIKIISHQSDNNLINY
jgi:hypothetical protein